MRMEQAPRQEEPQERFSREGFSLEDTNAIQSALMERYDAGPDAWVHAYGEAFRALILADGDELFALYQEDQGHCIDTIDVQLKMRKLGIN